MAWSYEICGPRTGDRYDSLPLSSVSWATRMNGQIGSGSAVVQTRDDAFEGWSSAYFKNITLPWRRVLVGKWDDIPIWAMIITDREYDFATGELTLQLAEIGELLRKRYYFPASSYSPSAQVTIGHHTPTSMLKAHVLNMTGGGYFGPSTARRMPVHVDVLAEGSRSFTTKQSEFLHPWDYLVEESEQENGIDWYFDPSFGSNSADDGLVSGFQWWFRTGRPMNRSEHHFDVHAPESPLQGLRVRDNATEFASTIFAVGEGTGDDRPVRRAGLDASPELARAVQFGQVSDGAKLLELARGELQFARNIADTWTFQIPADYALVRRGGQPGDGVRVGSWIMLDFDDRYWGTGQVDLYVIGMSGDGGETVNVEVQLR